MISGDIRRQPATGNGCKVEAALTEQEKSELALEFLRKRLEKSPLSDRIFQSVQRRRKQGYDVRLLEEWKVDLDAKNKKVVLQLADLDILGNDPLEAMISREHGEYVCSAGPRWVSTADWEEFLLLVYAGQDYWEAC